MTTTNTEIRAASDVIARDLVRAGMRATAYAKSPIQPNTLFTLSLDQQNVIRVWAGTARVTVIGDRSERQAVIQVYEAARTVTREVRVERNIWHSYHTLNEVQGDLRQNWMERHFGVQLPRGASYSIVEYVRTPDSEIVEPTIANNFAQIDYGTITVQGSVKATRQNFLVGRDEASQFISALPRQCSSVQDAHDALRPRGVPRTALRQGEWFFVPATSAERTRIGHTIESRGPLGLRQPHEYRDIDELERGSSHRAPSQIRIGQRLYASGIVFDTRPNRHGQLMLNDWHRVIRNREVVIPARDPRSIGASRPARFD